MIKITTDHSQLKNITWQYITCLLLSDTHGCALGYGCLNDQLHTHTQYSQMLQPRDSETLHHNIQSGKKKLLTSGVLSCYAYCQDTNVYIFRAIKAWDLIFM